MATPAAVLSIIVEANTTKAKSELSRFNKGLSDKSIKVTATLDKSSVAAVNAAKKGLGKDTRFEVEADIDMTSFARAKAGMALLTKESSKLQDVFSRSQLSIGQWAGILAASLPVVVDATAALGALTASAAAATLGLTALGIGGVGALTVGLAGIASVAAPAIANLGDLKTAQDAYTEAVERYGRNSSQAQTAMTKLAFEQKKAGPVAAKFAEQLSRLTQRWRGLTRAGQSDFIGLMSDGIDRLNRKLPLLAESANSSMRALRRGFDRFLDRATGPEFNRFIRVMTVTFAKSMGPVGEAFGNIAKVLQRIAVAVAPDLVRMMRGFRDMTQGWVDSTRNAEELRETIHGLVNQANTWWKLIKAVGGLFTAVLAPGAKKGKEAVEGITATIKEWTDWVNAHPKEMREFFKEGLETTEQLGRALLSFLPNLIQISTAMRPIARAFLVLTTGLNSLKIGNISALTVLFGLIIGTKLTKGAIGLAQGLGRVGTALFGSTRAAKGFRSLMETIALKGMYAKDAALEWASTMASTIRAKGVKVRDAIRATLTKARVFISTAATGAAEFIGSMVGSIRSSKLAQKLSDFFRRVAIRMGAIMAAATAAAVVVGEGIGGVASSLAGRLRQRLPGKMGKAGRVAGRAFGMGMLGGILLTIPLIVTMISNKIRDQLGGERDTSKGGGLFGGGISLGPLDDVSGWLQEHGGRSPVGHKGGLVTREGIVPQGFQHGGMVGRQGLRPGTGDTIPALLEVGELVIPKKMVDWTRKNAKLTAAAMTGELGKGHKKAAQDTDKFVRGHDKAWDKLRQMTLKTTQRFRKSTVDDFSKTSKDATDHTQKMRGNVSDGFGKMREQSLSSTQKMKEGMSKDFRDLGGAVKDGLQRIGRMTNNALDALGVKKVAFHISAQGKQRGGLIGGVGDGDKVPVMAEPGEGFINKKAVKAMGGKAAIDKLNRAVPRFAKGGTVGGLNFALGPYDIPPIQYAADHAGGNSHVHITGTTTPWVVGIGRQLQRMGFMVGEHPAFGGVNAQHSATGGHYDALAIDVNSAVDETQAEVAQIARLLKTGAAGAVAEKIKRVLLEGPKGPLKDMGQAALDKVRKAANDLVAKKTPTGVAGGITGDGDVERIFARAAKRLSTSKIATLALGMAGYAESGMRDLPGGDRTSQGALQLLASTAAGMNINPHDEGAIASAFLLRGYYGRGGANQLAASGLPAHLVAQNVQGSAFSDGSNYAAQESSARNWMKRFGLRRGGVVGPYVGSFDKGGTVGQTGLGLLHKGEHVLSMQKGGTVDDEFIRLPRWLENFQRWMKQLNNDLRRVTKNLETQLSQEQRKRLKKLERIDPEDRTKKQKRELDHLRELTKVHDKLTKAQKRERNQLQRNLRDYRDSMKKMKTSFMEDGKLSKAEKDKLKAAREEHRANRERLDGLKEQRRLHRREERREDRIGRRVEELQSRKALIDQLKELRGEIKEQNRNYKTIQASERVALNALANLVNAQIGAKGLEQGRLAAAGSTARY